LGCVRKGGGVVKNIMFLGKPQRKASGNRTFTKGLKGGGGDKDIQGCQKCWRDRKRRGGGEAKVRQTCITEKVNEGGAVLDHEGLDVSGNGRTLGFQFPFFGKRKFRIESLSTFDGRNRVGSDPKKALCWGRGGLNLPGLPPPDLAP